VLEFQDGSRKNSQASITHLNLQKPNTRRLVHSWSTFGARTSHGQPQTLKTHHGPNLGETTTFPPYSILCSSSPGPHPNGFLSEDFQMGIPKFPQLGFPRFWRQITWHADLWLQWGLKQSYSPCPKLCNGILHVACMRGNRLNSWILVVGSQIANLTPDLSFGHNLCLRCSNEWCKHI
jgi:hypothetical protein